MLVLNRKPRKLQKEINPGDRFGNLVIERLATDGERLWFKHFKKPRYLGTVFLCQCDCGNKKLFKGKDLNRGHAKSCDCSRYSNHKLEFGKAAFNDLFRKYKYSAKKRGFIFNLSEEEFKLLVFNNCEYCDAEPSEIKLESTFGSISANGVDRKNNEIGYVAGNCVSCCSRCNRAKGELTFEEFKEWATRLRNNLIRDN